MCVCVCVCVHVRVCMRACVGERRREAVKNCILLGCTVEPPLLILDAIRNQEFCPLQRGVPNSGASNTFLVGVVLCNWALQHNMATAYSYCMRRGRPSRGYIVH